MLDDREDDGGIVNETNGLTKAYLKIDYNDDDDDVVWE
jgi:hypothetical protein